MHLPFGRVRLASRLPMALCLLVVLAASVLQANGAPGPGTLASLRMGADPHYAPFQFRGRQQQPTGFDIELIDAVAAHAALQVEVAFGEWGDTLERLERGELDTVPMFISSRRERRFLFTDPFLLRYHLVFGRPGAAYIGSLAELAGHRVAVQYAGLAWEELGGNEPTTVELVETDSESSTVLAVSRGEADYALLPMGIGYDAVQHGGLRNVTALSPPLLERPYAFAVRPDRPELVEALNAGLRKVKASGEQDRLYMKWLGNSPAPARSGALDGVPPGWMVISLLLGVALLLLGFHVLVGRRTSARGHASRGGSRTRALDHREPLTGLRNRQALVERLRERIGNAPHEGGFAVVRINLLGLDMVESIAGEATSIEVQCAIAERVVVRHGDQHVASLGTGSIAVLVRGVVDGADADAVMRELATLMEQRIDIGGLPVELRCRIGLAVYPGDARSGEGLLRAASVACEAAHKQVTTAVRYHAGLEPDPKSLTLLAELREAIADGTLGYALQPKLDLATRRCVGAELLVRWNHPRHGALSPIAFVPLAEQAGIVGEMSLYLIRRGIAHCRQWRDQGHSLTLSVNVSANDLADITLVEAITAAAEGHGDALMLEVTETDVMRDTASVVEAVARLRQHGIRISLDDFGTGHSSLINLRRLNPDELKIDQSFVQAVRQSPSDQAIIHATIRLAHDLGAYVTAEGIEDDLTLEWLAQAGCDGAQGYGIAMPMDPETFLASLHLPPAADHSRRRNA
jgi:predicted signal transduction protein with EAL and GGDEF domain/ABC-type amino acid transport substrate-binding protein